MVTKFPNVSELSETKLAIGKHVQDIAPYLHHWRCHSDENNVQWWLLDQVDSTINVLSHEVLRELEELVSQAEKYNNRELGGIVIRSAKMSGFIVGADIKEFQGLDDASVVEELIINGTKLFQRLEDLKVPTIALIHGVCLGGGLELALACKYRIARSDSHLGFPEVQLGLHPGLGGSVRLYRQIRPPQALNIMLTGKPISAKKAKALGLIDAVGEERHFANAVEQVIAGKVKRQGRDFMSRIMHLPPFAQIIAKLAEKQTRKKVKREHYPAPFAILDNWRKHSVNRKAHFKAERESFAALLTSQPAQNLIRVFFLREALKSTGKAEAHIRHLHVVGAGVMGGEIAAWCAAQGFFVTIEDRAPEMIGSAVKRAHQIVQRKLHSEPERQAALDRFVPDVAGTGRKTADLIIEAVPEKVDLKRKILSAIERTAKPDAIIATNTSSIVLEQLSDALQKPERFIGIHFFNPVVKMQLVEIITHTNTSVETIERAQAFVRSIDRLPAKIKSAPGFLVNRVLTPYLLEALALLDEGYDKASIDQAAEDFGMPMGPVTLADFIGLDICLEVAETLHAQLEQDLYPIPQWLRDKVDKGQLGTKTNAGLYQYKHDKPQKRKPLSENLNEIQTRLILPMLNTAVHCLDENIVQSADHLDAAIIFATGFAPFTGGPIHYSQTRGPDAIRKKLESLQQEHGDRFKPAKGWLTQFDQPSAEPAPRKSRFA